jgi:tRNA threonylcarbamoyladenosine modification (KEOPS) complex  Pcc1 subunit
MEFEFPDEKTMNAAKAAISHEGDVGRAKTQISKNNNTLKINIESEDVVALRATANAYLRALQVIDEVRK